MSARGTVEFLGGLKELMSEFISKLQYKTSEDGEFYDEKPRNFDETLQLIKDFPWDVERYAEIDITGPSVTIEDENGNFLKMGIYYGGWYSLYYLDTKNNFHERLHIDVDEALHTIGEFFEGEINLQEFKKQQFGYLKRKYFKTSKLEYRVTCLGFILLYIFWWLYFLIFFSICILVLQPVPVLITLLTSGVFLMYLISPFYRHRSEYIQISRGNNVFYFGKNNEDVRAYNKKDIEKVLFYRPQNSRSPNMIEVIEVVFKDGSLIRFSNLLISQSVFSYKFSNKWKMSPVIIYKNTLRMI